MNTQAMKRIAEASPHLKSSITGIFYLLTIIAAGVVLFVHGKLGFAVVSVCYLAVMALFYDLFRPVSRSRSWLAASRNLLRQMMAAQIAAHSRRVHKEVRRSI